MMTGVHGFKRHSEMCIIRVELNLVSTVTKPSVLHSFFIRNFYSQVLTCFCLLHPSYPDLMCNSPYTKSNPNLVSAVHVGVSRNSDRAIVPDVCVFVDANEKVLV